MQTGGLILLSWCEYCILIEKSGTVYNVICGVKYFIKSQNIETNQFFEQNLTPKSVPDFGISPFCENDVSNY